MVIPVALMLDGLDSGGGPVANGIRRYRDRHQLDWQIHLIDPSHINEAPPHAWWILRTGGRVRQLAHLQPQLPITSLLGHDGPNHRSACDLNEAMMGTLAAQYLYEAGFRQTFTIDLQVRARFDQRRNGFIQACQRLGIHHDHYVRNRQVAAASSDASLVAWIQAQPTTVACYCVIDSQAAWLRQVALAARMRIPEELAILGTGDHTGSCLSTEPTLSTVAFPWGSMGEAAAAQVHRLTIAAAPPPVQRLRPVRVIERQSTRPPPPTDPMVAKAVQWLGKNLHEKRPLRALVAVVKQSEPTICRRFKAEFGFGPKQLHDQLRIRKAEALLAGSNDPIRRIAVQCGFRDATAFGVSFRRRRGCSPSEWRTALGEKIRKRV